MRFFHLCILLMALNLHSFAQPAFIVREHKKYYIKVNPDTYQVTFSGEDGTIYKGTPDLNSLDYNKVFDRAILQKGKVPPARQPFAKIAVHHVPGNFTLVGTGSGTLMLDVLKNQQIRIKPGNYSYINIKKADHVKIDATGVKLTGGKLDVEDGLNQVEIWGLTIENQEGKGIEISGFSNDVYLHDMVFRNITDFVISYRYNGIYDGTPASASKNFKFERLHGEHISRLFSTDGGFSEAGIINLMEGFKMISCKVKNSPDLGSVVWIAAGQDYEIADNVVDQVNVGLTDGKAASGNHNGIWHIVGNGSFHDNKVTNHQGNAIRAWLISYGSEMKTVSIYNNKVWQSYKYGAFEVQATPEIQEYLAKYPRRVSPAKTKVYNNTVGSLNTSREWEGQLLDLYNTLGPVEYYNNLGFELNRPNQKTTDMINYNGSGTTFKSYGNIYKASSNQAVADKINFHSLFKGVGAP